MVATTKSKRVAAQPPDDVIVLMRAASRELDLDGTFRVSLSLSDVVTSYLRSALVRCEIQPGERIQIRDVEQHLGVSHIPVREALRALEGEGLIVNVPRRGAIAAPVSVADLADLYDLRRLIEPEVAVRASHLMTASHLARVDQAADVVNRADANSEELISADRAFHWAILEPGATPLIARTLSQLWQTAERYVYIGMKKSATASLRKVQHRDIVAAIRARDEPRIRATYQNHLTLVEGAVREIQLDKD